MRPISERLSPAIRLLVILNSLSFAFYVLVPRSQGFFRAHIAMSKVAFTGEFWQPVTSLFVHLDFLSFLFNIIGLWFVGAAIERVDG